ncbi:Uncharacterized protein APZ42_021509 [Daphnia magna]|uniref:Uncharacterized protein n=1 Tax=Daphnia magna TaxID=35525 RepID=A0A164WLH9_9CRUS|nr:Uncharacterized protein APZ42_021509 [Daphnia magna]
MNSFCLFVFRRFFIFESWRNIGGASLRGRKSNSSRLGSGVLVLPWTTAEVVRKCSCCPTKQTTLTSW